jgi:transposase
VGDHGNYATQYTVVAHIRELYRLREDFHRAEVKLTLQVKAICRRCCAGEKTDAAKLYSAIVKGGDHPQMLLALPACSGLLAARAALEPLRKGVEHDLEKVVRKLRVWPWAKSVRGIGPLILAEVIGTAGDLGRFASPAKLWAWMGVGMRDGKIQRRMPGTLEEVLAMGYVPGRRCIAWKLGEGIVKASHGPYRDVYDARLVYEIEMAGRRGLTVATTVKSTADNWEAKGLPRPEVVKKLTAAHMGCGHIAKRAHRYLDKLLLRDLWSEWRKVCDPVAAPNDQST